MLLGYALSVCFYYVIQYIDTHSIGTAPTGRRTFFREMPYDRLLSHIKPNSPCWIFCPFDQNRGLPPCRRGGQFSCMLFFVINLTIAVGHHSTCRYLRAFSLPKNVFFNDRDRCSRIPRQPESTLGAGCTSDEILPTSLARRLQNTRDPDNEAQIR